MLHMGLELCLTRDLLVSSRGKVSCWFCQTLPMLHLEIQEGKNKGEVKLLMNRHIELFIN